MKIKIESGVPIPSTQRTGIIATLRAMKVGDSFLSDKQGWHGCAKTAGIKIVTRKLDNKQWRVWRTE